MSSSEFDLTPAIWFLFQYLLNIQLKSLFVSLPPTRSNSNFNVHYTVQLNRVGRSLPRQSNEPRDDGERRNARDIDRDEPGQALQRAFVPQ
jgi:hypothetical protein